MAIALVDKTSHKEKFRIVDNSKLVVLGLVHEPPEEIRYGATPVRMVEVSGKAPSLVCRQIQSVGFSKTIYLCGSFMLLRDDKTYRCYEATHKNQKWVRQIKEVHQVTGLATGKLKYTDLGLINITVQFDSSPPYTSDNPTQFGYIFSTDELKPSDVVGDFLIREVRKQYELWVARFEYKVITNG